jgi:hypothetical protein
MRFRRPAMDVIEVGGLNIAYERVGHGPFLVLLHGYVKDGPTTWRPQLEALSDVFTVVTWDAPSVPPIPPRSSACPATPTAWPSSSAGSAWGRRTWRGCPSAARCARLQPAPHRRRGERWYWHRLCRLAGSLPPGVSEQRLQEALTLADLSAEEFVGALLPTMFSEGAPADVVAAFGVRPCARSAPSAFGPWPGHRPRMSP